MKREGGQEEAASGRVGLAFGGVGLWSPTWGWAGEKRAEGGLHVGVWGIWGYVWRRRTSQVPFD